MYKLHTELFDAASQTGTDRLYRLWALLRAIDADGRGVVAISELRGLVRRHRLRGLSPAVVSRLLRDGRGTWWDTYRHNGRRWVAYRSLGNVCVSLGVPKLRRHPVCVPFRYARTLRVFRAVGVYARFAGNKLSAPISRATLERLTGVAPRTQRAYASALCETVDVVANAATTSQTWAPGDGDVPDGHFVDYVDGKLRVVKRLPNSYRASLLPAARGMVRRVNRRLRGNPVRTVAGTGTRSDGRLFYHKPKAAVKRELRGDEGDSWYTLGGDGQRAQRAPWTRSGVRLWTLHRVANGHVYCG